MSVFAGIDDPRTVAEDGERIYDERYRDAYEAQYAGQFAAIDVKSGRAVVSEYPEVAIEQARTSMPGCVLHLVRIGSPSAYRMSFFFASEDAGLVRAI